MEPKTLLDTDVLSGCVHPTGWSARNHNERSRDRRPRDPCCTMLGQPRGYREHESHFVVQVTERFGTRPFQSLGTGVVAPALPLRRSSKSPALRGLPSSWTWRARKSPVHTCALGSRRPQPCRSATAQETACDCWCPASHPNPERQRGSSARRAIGT